MNRPFVEQMIKTPKIAIIIIVIINQLNIKKEAPHWIRLCIVWNDVSKILIRHTFDHINP